MLTLKTGIGGPCNLPTELQNPGRTQLTRCNFRKLQPLPEEVRHSTFSGVHISPAKELGSVVMAKPEQLATERWRMPC